MSRSIKAKRHHFSQPGLAASHRKDWKTCSVPYAWSNTCNHRMNHDRSTYSEQMAKRRTACDGKTGVAIAANKFAGVASKTASMEGEGSRTPTSRQSNSQA